MITLRKNIPTNINKDLSFIESINKKESFTDLKNPNQKSKKSRLAEWDPVTHEIVGVIDES